MDTNIVVFPRQSDRLKRANYFASADRLGSMRASCFKLLAADKIELFRWEAEGMATAVVRIAVHEGSGICEEDSDVALLYAPGGLWARWGLARHGTVILVWRCTDGQDLGRFGSVREALDAVAVCDSSKAAPNRPLRVIACSA